MIRIEVAYALPERQTIIALEVEENCSVLDAAKRDVPLATVDDQVDG